MLKKVVNPFIHFNTRNQREKHKYENKNVEAQIKLISGFELDTFRSYTMLEWTH
jgi:hypothetical protein